MDDGQLELVSPAYYIDGVPDFAEAFLEIIDHDDEVQSRLGRPLEELQFAHIHVGKLDELADKLQQRDLARPSEGPGWEPWVDVEVRTADLFMAYLAGALGGTPGTYRHGRHAQLPPARHRPHRHHRVHRGRVRVHRAAGVEPLQA